jgi:hypothetical protein
VTQAEVLVKPRLGGAQVGGDGLLVSQGCPALLPSAVPGR